MMTVLLLPLMFTTWFLSPATVVVPLETISVTLGRAGRDDPRCGVWQKSDQPTPTQALDPKPKPTLTRVPPRCQLKPTPADQWHSGGSGAQAQ